MAESVDCSEFCRLCLVKEQVNTHIFEDLGELQQIHVKITACLPIKVAYEDSLPKRICDDCIYKLDQQYQFWNTTINSEKQLKQWLGILDVPIPKQEPEKSKIKKEKEQEQTVTKTRPRRNARRKAAQNVRQAAAAAIAASDSDAGIGGDDMDIDHFAKEENDSDEDYHDNTESLEENTYTNVGLDSEEQGEAEAGPSGLQKSAAAPSANSGSDNGGAGLVQIKIEEVDESLKIEQVDEVIMPSIDTFSDSNSVKSEVTDNKKKSKKNQKRNRKIIKTKSNESYKCDECSRSFKHKGFLEKHNREVHGSVPTECDFCLTVFDNKKEMKAHRREHLVLYDYHCEKCSLGYGSERELKGHMNSRHGINPHKCPLCPDRVFKSPYKLKVHSLTHYKLTNTPYEEHKCHLCEKIFHHQKYLNVHLKLHAGETKVVCDICGKTLNSKQSLDEHLNLHNGIKPYTCKICNKSFVKRNTLRVHKFTHTSEKPHKCDEPGCGKSFTQSSNLVTHKRYHTGERPYKCNFCSAEFVSSFILRDHLQKMHHIVRESSGRDLQSTIYPLFV